MEDQTKVKVRGIDSLWTFVVAVAFIGPLALPLLWRNPRFSKKMKSLGSLAVVAVTVGLLWFSGSAIKDGYQIYQQLKTVTN